MAMGYGATTVYELSVDYLETFDEYNKLCELLKQVEVGKDAEPTDEPVYIFWKDEISDAVLLENRDPRLAEAHVVWAELQDAFIARHPTLSIYAGWHDSKSEGSRNDDINGLYFGLYGAMVVSPEAEKIKEFWSEASFVSYC